MDRVLTDEIVQARRHYACDACHQWMRSGYSLSDCETSDQRMIVDAARADKWRILPGQQYRRITGICNGALTTYRARPGMQSVIEGLRLCDALRRERDELSTQVHIITSERDELADCVQSLRAKHAELAARLAEIEAQKPVAFFRLSDAEWLAIGRPAIVYKTADGDWREPLYSYPAPAPAAAPERAERISEIERWKRIAENAQAVTAGGNDQLNYFEVPAHLMAALALALDEWPGAQGQAGAEAAAPDHADIKQHPPVAWILTAEGCDGSADWTEIGPEQPEPVEGFTAVPLRRY